MRLRQWDRGSNTLMLKNENRGITGVLSMRFVDDDTVLWSVVSKDKQGKVYLDPRQNDSSRVASFTNANAG